MSWFPTPKDLAQWGSPARKFPLDEAQVREFLRQTLGEDPKMRMWIAEADGSPVATASTIFDWDQGVVLLGFIAVAPRARGNGLAKLFLEDVLDRTFSDKRIERVELNVYTFNTGAVRLYEKLGFTREGVRRSLARMGTERWDAIHYSLLRPEHERLRRK